MQRIGEEVPVLPVPMVAHVLLEADAPLTEEALRIRVGDLIDRLGHAHVHLPRDDRAYTVEVGLRMLRLRDFVETRDGTIAIVPGERDMLSFYAASIAHHLRDRSG